MTLRQEVEVVRVMMPPWLMERGSPGWRRGRSARSLGVVACAFAVAAAVVVSLCFVGGALASGKLSYLLCSLFVSLCVCEDS